MEQKDVNILKDILKDIVPKLVKEQVTLLSTKASDAPTLGIPVDQLPSVVSNTDLDILYSVQSNQPKKTTVKLLNENTIRYFVNLPKADPPVDSVVCVQNGNIVNVSVASINAVSQPVVYNFSVNSTNLTLDCSTLPIDITEIDITIDTFDLPSTGSVAYIFNVVKSNVKKVYIKKRDEITFSSYMIYPIGSGRYANLKIMICLNDKSANADKVNHFRFSGFVEGRIQATGAFNNKEDIILPAYQNIFADYLEISNKKVNTFFSIAGLRSIIDFWTNIDIVTNNASNVIEPASWIFLFGKNVAFTDYTNASFTIKQSGSSNYYEMQSHAYKCVAWAMQGYSRNTLAYLINNSFILAENREGISVSKNPNSIGILGYNRNRTVFTSYSPYFNLAKSNLSGKQSLEVNKLIKFTKIGGLETGSEGVVPIAWVLANIDYFER